MMTMASAERGGAGNAGCGCGSDSDSDDGGNKSRCNAYAERQSRESERAWRKTAKESGSRSQSARERDKSNEI